MKEEDKIVLGFLASIIIIVSAYLIWGYFYPI